MINIEVWQQAEFDRRAALEKTRVALHSLRAISRILESRSGSLAQANHEILVTPKNETVAAVKHLLQQLLSLV